MRDLEHFESYQLQIFNRWGKQVFAGQGDVWQNLVLWWPDSSGLYYYWLTVGGKPYKGWVQVVK